MEDKNQVDERLAAIKERRRELYGNEDRTARMLVDIDYLLELVTRSTAPAEGFEYSHERQAKLVREDGMMCEAHPGLEFGHDSNCAGPGMPWMIEGKAAIQSVTSPAVAEGHQTYLEAQEGQCAECRKWLVWADNLTGNKHYLASKMRQEISIRLQPPAPPVDVDEAQPSVEPGDGGEQEHSVCTLKMNAGDKVWGYSAQAVCELLDECRVIVKASPEPPSSVEQEAK